MKSKYAAALVTGLALHSLTATASAVPAIFSGADNGSGTGAHPISDASAAAFDLATPTANLITFESAATANFTSLLVATGVTASLTNNDTTLALTSISADNTNATLGFNTTVGGTKSVRLIPLFSAASASLTFAFATPIDAFGFYLTGSEATTTGTFTLNFNDGTSQSLPITKNALAGAQFFGFTDIGASITSVALTETGPFTTRDIIGVDDIRYRSVPEPTALAAIAGVAMLAGRRRR